MAYNNENNIRQIITFYRDNGYSDNFICGLLGNWQSETASTFNPTEVQHSYKQDNEEYTNNADYGLNDFCADRIGYGLAQWTSQGRKAGLYNYAKSQKKSVGDLITQCEWTIKEINSTGYGNIRKAIKNNASLEEFARVICTDFERPASMQTDKKEAAIQVRINYALKIKEYFFSEVNNMSKKVMIDAGHDNNRNVSPVFRDYNEATFAWKLQEELKTELQKYGIEVGTTRKTKAEVKDVVARGKCAKGYDLFISLHSNACNTASVRRVSGIYVCKDSKTDISSKALDITTKLTKAVTEVMGISETPKNYYKLAGYDRNGNGITTDDDYYGVLYGAHIVKVPGLILEHSFHTNATSAKWLYQDENIHKLAVKESEVIANYFSLNNKIDDTANEQTETKTIVYTVVKGDSLAKIASKYSTTVDEIVALNPCIKNKNVIAVGWKLTIPTNTDGAKNTVKTYKVVKGDSLSKIAKRYSSVTWKQIATANNIKFPYTLTIGQVLIIP